jgi:hypothetical protein
MLNHTEKLEEANKFMDFISHIWFEDDTPEDNISGYVIEARKFCEENSLTFVELTNDICPEGNELLTFNFHYEYVDMKLVACSEYIKSEWKYQTRH